MKYFGKPLAQFDDRELTVANLAPGREATLNFASGYQLTGRVMHLVRRSGLLLLIRFADSRLIDPGGRHIFNGKQNKLTLAVGDEIISVFAGSADQENFNVLPPKSANNPIEVKHSVKEIELFSLYQDIALMRITRHFSEKQISGMCDLADVSFPSEWLLHLELLELAKSLHTPNGLIHRLEEKLAALRNDYSNLDELITSGVELSALRTHDLMRTSA